LVQPPLPIPDRIGGNTVPRNIAIARHAVGVLLGEGRHLLDTLHRRACAPNFASFAACFGTSKLATLLAHLNLCMLCATALQRVLLARAATSRDIIATCRIRTDEPPPAPADTPSKQPKRTRRASPLPGSAIPNPTLEERERQVRRRPFGRTI